MKTLSLALLCLTLFVTLTSGKNHVKREQMYKTKRDASTFLKSKSDQEVKAPGDFEKLEEAAEDAHEKAEEANTDSKDEQAEETSETKYDDFEECVSECYWHDWKLDFKGVGFEERMEASQGHPDGPMEKFVLFPDGNKKPELSKICTSCFDKQPAGAKVEKKADAPAEEPTDAPAEATAAPGEATAAAE